MSAARSARWPSVGAVLSSAIVVSFFSTSLALAEGPLNEPVAKALEQSAPAASPPPATIFVASKVITMEADNPFGDAIAVSGKRIVAVGRLEGVKKALGERPYAVDRTFESKIVMPGFIDQHLHPILGALTR